MEQNHEVITLSNQFNSKEFEHNYHYSGNDLGATLHDQGTTFKVWAPTATSVILHLYVDGNPSTSAYQIIGMSKTAQGIWEYKTPDCLDGTYYTYEVSAMNQVQMTGDIYAKACAANGMRSMVVDLSTTNPEGFMKDQFLYDPNKQPIIYELHIKDFSYDVVSGIDDAYRGKYLAFTQEETFIDCDTHKPTCVEYLKELGITHVHILPMYDYGSIDELGSDEQFNWGYDPVNYNVPEGSYSTDPSNGKTRIRELKAMVLALHKAGIGVIMDVVYNHTYSTDSFFQRTVPYYYYRTNEHGDFANGSACSNETASERSMFRKYMIESVMYLAREYHLDGFRFDLMGLHDTDTMNLIRESLNTLPNGNQILVYGEPWAAETPAMPHGVCPADKAHLHLLDQNIAIFNDDTRDAIKGSVFYERESGYVNGSLHFSTHIPNAVCAWDSPSQIISYVSAHDNFSLYDKLVLSMTENPDFATINQELIQVNKLCAGIIFTSCGSSFFQAGEEFARTKDGIGDSYNSPATINMLDWNRAYINRDLVSFYRNMIAFRKTIPTFMKKDAKPREEITFISQPTEHVVSFLVTNENGKHCMIAYNPLDHDITLSLPDGNWSIMCDGTTFAVNTTIDYTTETTLMKKATMILIER